MSDFSKTPSFYNNQEVFRKYLGYTSYYSGLQDKILKIIKKLKPEVVLEMGFGTGYTAVKTAQQNPQAEVVAIDVRPEMIPVAKQLADNKKVSNITFITSDMTDFAKTDLKKFDAIYFLYAFHHIDDPLERKIRFLADCYKNMKEGAVIIIGETFIPEDYREEDGPAPLIELFEKRGAEGYASTFWASLKGIDEKSIAYAHSVADYCRKMETDAGRLVAVRDNEYLVKRSWLRSHAGQAGFSTVLDMELDTLSDAVMVFRK